MERIIISICINTYKRPKLLLKLLKSLNEQKLDIGLMLEIIVVDNSPNKEGIYQVTNFLPNSKHYIKFAEQPIKNISITRNKAVSLASGDYICFIDDDAYADKNWVQNLFDCLQKFKANIVMGLVIPYYDTEIPNWIKKGKYFNYLHQKTGEESIHTRTGNCILKREKIKYVEGPFDPNLGLTGGEDVKLFGYLRSKGSKIIFCEEAIVYDFIPKERANLKWLTQRYFRNGITSTENKINNSKIQFFARLYFLIKYVIFLFLSIILTLIFSLKKVHRNFWYLKTIGNLGHIACIFGIKYQEYK